MATWHEATSRNRQLIGAMVTHFNTPISSNILSGAEIASGQFGYSMVVTQSMNRNEKRMNNLERLLALGVDGLFVSSAYSQERALVAHLEESDIPRVVFEASSLIPSQPKKRLNDFQNAYELTNYLVENGCKSIAHISLPIGTQQNNFLSGYKEALRLNDLLKMQQADEDTHTNDSWLDVPEMLLSMPQLDGILFSSHLITAVAWNASMGAASHSNEWRITGKKGSIDTRNEKIVEVGKLAATLLISLCRRKSSIDKLKLCSAVG
ncbi:LacI family DNA-binding transcriptional regulator [Pseudochryseolinea flava]|uniref:Periplasmic binding protein/LacI sugar binding domain-containing protein n=1 Tax=Pseudochryseolinea flava TaxID=2059302 RepID=A0A364XZ64_9BACT|nr:substrate-binding domain-containing protein [Pseudochryseolinea flava]RAV98896.1 hypothetical protein DQQ10_21585 [Pseudochryseolinea flava]